MLKKLTHAHFLHPVLLGVIILNVFLGAWSVLHGDILFSSDIARDFLLLQEIEMKKIILIGPRASGFVGLFHGPLWLYLNYPAYLVGHGNPVVVGWFWVMLTIVFLITSFFIAKKLFTEEVAYIYVVLLSTIMIFETNGLFNPHGAMFLMPLFFYSFVLYYTSLRFRYLLLHLFCAGLIIQFQMAVGVPLLVLSAILIMYILVKNKKFIHITAFGILLLPLSTFIIFDIRHNFSQLHALLHPGNTTSITVDFISRISSRFDLLRGESFQLFRGDINFLNSVVAFFVVIFFYELFRGKPDKHRYLYYLFLYFYIGFYVISLFYNGYLLYHYIFPLVPLLFLFLASISMYVNKKIFLIFLIIVVGHNIFLAVSNYYIASRSTSTYPAYINYKVEAYSENSWRFQRDFAQKLFSGPETEFGYFIFTPDMYAYKPKYAISYIEKMTPSKKAYRYEKKPVTYLIVAPPPKDHPELKSENWKASKVKMISAPVQVITTPISWQIERYLPTEKELKTPPASGIDDWIYFR